MTLFVGNYFEVHIDADYEDPPPQTGCAAPRHCIYVAHVMSSYINPTIDEEGQTWKSYYYAGSKRIAMRIQDHTGQNNEGVYWLYADRLGSTMVTVSDIGIFDLAGEMCFRAAAWGVITPRRNSSRRTTARMRRQQGVLGQAQDGQAAGGG